ncbi:hypothetical protein GCM10020295_17110 [Streptomyces cinereospinus]
MIEPVRIEGDGTAGTVRVTNAHDFADLSALAFEWSRQVDGETAESGPLPVPPLAPGESADVKLPGPAGRPRRCRDAVDGAGGAGRGHAVGGNGGHPVAWAQLPVARRRPPAPAAGEPPAVDGPLVRLGPAVFDARTGALRGVGGVEVTSPRLDVWRAPTDNDNGAPWQPDARLGPRWRKLGLHRMRHRLDAVEVGADALAVRTRVAPAGAEVGLRTVYRWTADGARLRLSVSVTPEGDWPLPLPRLGVRFGLAAADRVTWFGGGPGEAYPDTRSASMLGRWHATVDALQTPYVRPQENGARADVRWVELGGLRVEGDPEFWFTARRWTTEQLDAAGHLTDLVPGETVWVNLDHGQMGIGSQSCGPGVLPQYHLHARPATFSFVFTELGAGPA